VQVRAERCGWIVRDDEGGLAGFHEGVQVGEGFGGVFGDGGEGDDLAGEFAGARGGEREGFLRRLEGFERRVMK